MVSTLAAFVLMGISPSIFGAAPVPVFETDIQPLFKLKCLRCHGDQAKKAALDLRTHAGALKGGESGPAIVPGKPKQSLLYEKVNDGLMPPGKKNRLTPDELAAIRRWIEAGAPSSAKAMEARALSLHDILPILLRRCTVCHGARVREGGLDLRSKAAMLRGGKSGPAIMRGNPAQSLILRKIERGEMPPLRRIIEVSIKPIEPAETELLTRWIALGAPEVSLQPDVGGTEPDPLVSDKDRDFWAFRPPRPVSIPVVQHAEQVRNPIDAFILQRLERKGLTLSAEADRATLLRRVYLDLTGLPPEPAEVRAFLADHDPLAYERIVDRLLASPRYGERWGRHWLDVAGYSDSEGKREQDLDRPSAYRYRDYVIRSLNADKPYDRFLLEQIAGDELADYEHAPEITPAMYDNLVATGFLRMAPDPTWYQLTNFIPDRLEVIADEIDVFGSAVLGLTLKCARCHSHKYDPIPQRDYYRLLAVFKGAFDEHDWMKSNWLPGLSMGRHTDRDLSYVSTAERRQWETHNREVQKEIDALRADRKGRTAETDRRIQTLEGQRLPEPKIRALWDRGEPSPTYIYRRGDYLSIGALVGPGVPSVLTDGKTPFEVKPPWPGASKTGRRLALARWLTQPDHPLTARVMVNRMWKHHFGVGLVKTLDNFGKSGARPSHPELLDWLAREFVSPSPPTPLPPGERGEKSPSPPTPLPPGERGLLLPSPLGGEGLGVRGWSIKAMHRLMVTSATYRQASQVTAAQEELDPDNALYSRMPLQRLSAEQLYDAMLLAAGRLDETRYGPPDPVEAQPDGLVTPVGTAKGWRRLIYIRQQRKQMPTHLENFDYPQMNPNCMERRDSTVATQALHLMNNGMVQQLADAFAQRVKKEAGSAKAEQIEWAYLIALGRPPTVEEGDIGQAALARLTVYWTNQLGSLGLGPETKPQPAVRALAGFCHTLLNSAAFVYID